LAVWFFRLDQLLQTNLLRQVLVADEIPLMSAWTMRSGRLSPVTATTAERTFKMSRFAYVRAESGRLLAETPLSAARAAIHDARAATLLAALAEPRDVDALIDAVPALPPDAIRLCLGLLAQTGIIAAAEDGRLEEERDATLRQWQFHDLLFQARARLGRHDDAFGGTFRFRGAIPPLPAVKTPADAEFMPLPRFDLARCAAGDPSLTEVVEARRSLRHQGARPITRDQLAEFLFRVARVDRVLPPDPERQRWYEISTRPYPSGGATYDLELYLVVDRCEGIAAGVYHYDAGAHGLRRVAEPGPLTDLLIDGARLATKTPMRPQVLIVLTSRFQRLSWKYETIAYATTLKNVGVLFELMYLTATAMGLAPCALGGGDSDLFATITGTDYLTEASVGEFMLGTRDTVE
jgi:SagB-type dehydrogenase family enzyme